MADTCSDTSLTGWSLVKSIDATCQLAKKMQLCIKIALAREANTDLNFGSHASRRDQVTQRPG